MEKNNEEKKIQKLNYLCITSSNNFKIMDNMHLALVNDHFQKTLGILEENAFGNFFQLFFNKIFPIKTNSDLYFQNIFLVEKFNTQIKDISDSMNFMLNYDYNGELSLNKEMIEHIGNILLFGFAKIKNKFKFYLIKSYADFKEKLESVKFHQIDLLNEYYNQEIFEKKKKKNKNIQKYKFLKDPFVDKNGKILAQESKLLPNELILLLNKLQFIKTLSIQIENIFTDINNNTNTNIEMIKYLIILINIQWLLPNILVVNFNLSNLYFSNALIDIMYLKLASENKISNIYEKKTFYPLYQASKYNFDLLLNTKKKEIISIPDNILLIYNQMKKNKNNSQEKDINFQIDYSDEEDYDVYDNTKKENVDSNIDNKKISKKEIIKELYNNYINKYSKELDLIIIITYYIRILDKLHALNMKVLDSFRGEIRECYNSISNSREINFLNLLIDVNQLNILDIQFNSLDFTLFEKILGIINSNINLSSLKLIFFSFDKFYSYSGIYKILNDINDPNLNFDLLNANNNFEQIALNQFFLEKFQKNLEILCILIRNKRKIMNELSLLLNIPSLILNNDNFILSLIKFIINIFIFLCFDKNQIKIFKLIAPLIKLDNRKTIFLNDFFGKIEKNQLINLHTLFLQFNFYKMNNIVNLINTNLNTLNIGNLDLFTFSSFVEKYISDEFISESKLVNVKIILNENIIEYNNEIKINFLKLFGKNPKNLLNFDIITNIKINYEQLHELIILIKKNYVNKYIIIFNKLSINFVNEIIKNDLPYIVALNKKDEEKLKNLTKLLITKIKEKENGNDNKSLKLRKKIFNSVKMMMLAKKDIKFE